VAHSGTNAIPALLESLDYLARENLEARFRQSGISVEEWLEMLGKPAAPQLQKALRSGSPKAREWATNALMRIAPEALTNAPPK
jgi:hypothetical protein